MKIGYIECFAGISGDMLLGSLIDAGASLAGLQQTVAALGLDATLEHTSVIRSGIRSSKVSVLVQGRPADGNGHHHHHSSDEHHHAHHQDHDEHTHSHSHEHARTLPVILDLIRTASLDPRAEAIAVKAFRLLAHAEATIHGIPEEQVHFHEVGAVDAIVDIVCNAVAIVELGLDEWYCSAINVGSGSVQCAHGLFPVPAPATAELLKGLPTYSSGPQMELVTPTGAALLRAIAVQYLERPLMSVSSIGYGAGTRNPQGFPNVVRVSIGTLPGKPTQRQKVTVIECAVDDQSPELLGHVLHQALAQGALDVMLTPVTMKKSRLGTLLTVLAPPAQVDTLAALLLRETTTLGVRLREEERICLDRHFEEVETPFGKVKVKVGSLHGEAWNFAPEFEDCRKLANEKGVPLKEVMSAAIAALSRRKEETIQA